MGDLFLSLLKFRGDLVQEISHSLLSVKHGSGLFVTGDVILNLLLEIFVDLFVLQDAHQAFINLGI